MRKKIVAGNWKMNNDLAETEELLSNLKLQWVKEPEAVVIIAPPFPNLYHCFQSLREIPVEIAAQNMHQAESGAYTGEVSAKMLCGVGVKSVILGHSERRNYFGETDEILAAKVKTALANDLKIIFCVGENLEQRQAEQHFSVVEDQVKDALFQIAATDWKKVVIAYEPVWAIGTGETASPEQVQEIHAHIRKTIATEVGQGIADEVSILYGGSVKPSNAKEIFAKQDVDGGLIGGASLNAEDFLAIVHSF